MHRVKTIQCNGTEDYLPGADCPAEKREKVMGVRVRCQIQTGKEMRDGRRRWEERLGVAKNPGTHRLGEDLVESFPDIKRTA